MEIPIRIERRMILRKVRKILLGLAALYVVLLGGLFGVMRDPIVFGKVMSKIPDPLFYAIPFKRLWFVARAGSLKVGDNAPDFRLSTGDKKSLVQLSSFRGQRPVVLIFGSYT